MQYGHVLSPAQAAVDVVVQLLVSESIVLLEQFLGALGRISPRGPCACTTLPRCTLGPLLSSAASAARLSGLAPPRSRRASSFETGCLPRSRLLTSGGRGNGGGGGAAASPPTCSAPGGTSANHLQNLLWLRMSTRHLPHAPHCVFSLLLPSLGLSRGSSGVPGGSSSGGQQRSK